MNKIVSLVLLACFWSNMALADCDWSKIKKNPDNTFTYTEELHLCVGQLVQANKDLTSAIQLKDLAIINSDTRIALWSKTAGDEQDRLAKIESESKHNDWLFFGLGIATTMAAAYAASQLIHR